MYGSEKIRKHVSVLPSQVEKNMPKVARKNKKIVY